MEIARMLGGDADREVSRAHARELLARGDQELQKTEEPTRKAGSKAPKTAASPNGAQRRGKPV